MSSRACPCTPLLPALALTLVAVMGCREPATSDFRYSTDASSRAGLVALKDGVLTANEAGAVVRLERSGRVAWRAALDREVATRPALLRDSVIAGTAGGDLVRLTLADGAVQWRLTGEPPVLTAPVADAEGKFVFLVAPDGAVRSLFTDTGKTDWERPPPGKPEPTAAPRGFPVPVLQDGVLVVALGDAGLMALATQDGAKRWQRDVRDVLGMTLWRDTLYVSTRQGHVLALRLGDGSSLWEQAPSKALSSPPSIALGTVWVGTAGEASALVGLSPSDGKEVTRITLPDPLVSEVTPVREDLLLVPTSGRQGRLIALNTATWAQAFSVRADTPLRTRPVVLGDQVIVLGLDGRVLSWRLRKTEP
ncbi:PQQ-binding-like beta-propeller repeat protein [Myxococcus sp. SDU36]|uniref:outer membrane protein assembly factor BamB family protein n=1 Tax=Myxococcus sp. SDU36 TaxID=2831967 RepID=UPI002543B177|nr:PQQ-binding-like beta-propeller repeat protein [Myxococcus sp. SDU36]WIG95489.1 PQQ-binding-like beta-propeller repeat protein [Myxococcus sp. SDU36]